MITTAFTPVSDSTRQMLGAVRLKQFPHMNKTEFAQMIGMDATDIGGDDTVTAAPAAAAPMTEARKRELCALYRFSPAATEQFVAPDDGIRDSNGVTAERQRELLAMSGVASSRKAH